MKSMKLHELKYEVRKRRGKPEGDAEKKLYNAITSHSDFSYEIQHMRVLKNGTVAQFVNSLRDIIIWIEANTLPMPDFPGRFTVIKLKEDFILQNTEEELGSFLTKTIYKILHDRLQQLIRKLNEERENLKRQL